MSSIMHAGALTNGSVQVWTTTGNFGKSAALDVINVPQAQMPLFGKQTWKYAWSAKHVAKNAHPPGTEVSDIKMMRDGVSLLTRGADDTLKLWDIRLLKQSVHAWDVPATHTHTRMCVSPKEDLVLTGAYSSDIRCSMPEHGTGLPQRTSEDRHGQECQKSARRFLCVAHLLWPPVDLMEYCSHSYPRNHTQ